MNILKFENQQEWLVSAVEEIVSFMVDGAVIGLAGGSTPKPVYEAMEIVDLSGVRFISIDERYDDGSNKKMISEAMPDAEIKFFETGGSVEDGLNDMSRYLDSVKAERGYIFDLLILGMGPDGHIASLFPDSDEGEDLAVHTQTENFDVKDRMSLSYEALLSSRKVVLLISGEEKMKLLENLKEDLPVYKILVESDVTVFAY